MTGKTLRIGRAGAAGSGRRARPVMLAVAGDSAAGKSTISAGIVAALGPGRCAHLSTDDYLRHDRLERRALPVTPLHPDTHHIAILEQHLRLLAGGEAVLKPVYDHRSGRLTRPELVEPREFVIVDGLLPLHTTLARACFDVTVFLDPAEDIRRHWKLRRDTTTRGYTPDQVLAELAAREADAAAFIRPQRSRADIVVRFAPIPGRPGAPLSAEVLLRATIPQPDLAAVLTHEVSQVMHLRLARDVDGRPVDSLHVHGYVPPEEGAAVVKAMWEAFGDPGSGVPEFLGRIGPDEYSAPLAIIQVLLLHHLLEGAR
ncbi:MAG: phosphoribulokinase [Pseudonocardia sp.]